MRQVLLGVFANACGGIVEVGLGLARPARKTTRIPPGGPDDSALLDETQQLLAGRARVEWVAARRLGQHRQSRGGLAAPLVETVGLCP